MLSETNARDVILGNQFGFKPMRVASVQPKPRVGGERPDYVIRLTWNGVARAFAAEYSSGSTPLRIETAITRARRYSDGFLPMIIAPYLSPEQLDRLVEVKMSGIDLSGNGVVIVPGQWFVYRTGQANQFPASGDIKDIYKGKSSLVGRVLLLRRKFKLVKDVRAEILRRNGNISLGTVSKVLKGLEEDLVVRRKPVIEVVQPDRLLDLLVDNYESPNVSRRVTGKMDLGPGTLARMIRNAEERDARLAADGADFFVAGAPIAVWTIFTSTLASVMQGLELQETRRFANVEFVETTDPRIYFDRRYRDSFVWTSPIQAYLELASGGKRERELAEQLRSDILEYRYS